MKHRGRRRKGVLCRFPKGECTGGQVVPANGTLEGRKEGRPFFSGTYRGHPVRFPYLREANERGPANTTLNTLILTPPVTAQEGENDSDDDSH
jgi:hypothetical protein